jgi:hypothetical protein
VQVSDDCNGSQNQLFVPALVPGTIAAGLTSRAQQGPPAPLSCDDKGLGAPDFVLTPADVTLLNNILAQMNAHIETMAVKHGYAVVPLEVLYGRADLKPTFSSVALMTSAQPYGQFMSLDGIHPNNAGHAIIAGAAADAVSEHYGIMFPRRR